MRSSATSPRILLLPASGPGVGGGHLVRCLALAEAAQLQGARPFVVADAEGGDLVRRLSGGGVRVVPRPRELTAAALPDAEAIVVDDYRIDAQGEAELRAPGRTLMAIDDLADRPHACDLLLDPSFQRRPSAYQASVPKRCELLLGPAFALLRPPFAKCRPDALRRRREGPLRRLFLGFGLGDVQGIAGRAVRAVRAFDRDLELDLAIGAGAESLPELNRRAEAESRLHLHVEASDVAGLMAEADAALGGGGVSTWERACLGLPSLAVILAENQAEMTWALCAAGVQLCQPLNPGGFEAELIHNLRRLALPTVRRALSSAAAALCDGEGAARAAEALLRRIAS